MITEQQTPYRIFDYPNFENTRVSRFKKNNLIFKGKYQGQIKIVEEFDNDISLLRQDSCDDYIDKKKIYIPTRYLLVKIIDGICVKCIGAELGKDFVRGKKFFIEHYLHKLN